MNAVFKVYDALKRNGMDDNDARLLSETIGEGRRGERFDEIAHTLAQHGERFNEIEHTLAQHGERLNEIEHTLAQHGERLGNIETRLTKVETKLDTGFMFMRWAMGLNFALLAALIVNAFF